MPKILRFPHARDQRQGRFRHRRGERHRPRFCRVLARSGTHVALADIQPDALERARSEIAALGVRAIALTLDVSDADAFACAADAGEAEFGKVHIICNNAGISLGNVRLLDMTRAQWDWIFGVNLFAVVNGLQAFVPRIQKHGEGGHIVNIASMAGLQVNPNIPGIGDGTARQRHRHFGAMPGTSGHHTV